MTSRVRWSLPIIAAVMGSLLVPGVLAPQVPRELARGGDTVTVVAGPNYDKPALYRWLFGGSYRDLWLRPIRVPVLDLRTFDGGLEVDELGGGNATLSLRLDSKNGSKYVFRTVDKDPKVLPGIARGGFPRDVARDRTASTHPAANLAHEPFYAAANVIHDTYARMFVMADDEILGEHRDLLAGRLGVLTYYPSKKPEHAEKYGKAIEIADSDSLVLWMNRSNDVRVAAIPYLRARLVDMLLNNWDRHPGNWKWARLVPEGPWHPLSRDMDNVFVSQDGFLPELAKAASPKMLTFDSTYPPMRSLVYKGGMLDPRFLIGTSRATFDSVARDVRDRITDEVIQESMRRMPPEYATSHAGLVARLKVRRDSIPAIADRWYLWMNAVAEVHGTDEAERATITWVDSQYVDVTIVDDEGEPYLARRFDARETAEVRIYLHGGDDEATVEGSGPAAMPVRIIGGNGNNSVRDPSGLAHLYEPGPTEHVRYGVDTAFNRRPLASTVGTIAGKDHGRGLMPIVGLGTNRDHGLTPKLGMAWESYGFRKVPYATRLALEGRYSFRVDGWAVQFDADSRLEESRLHFGTSARFSQLELLNYHGLGNDTPGSPGVPVGERAERNTLFSVNQDQWLMFPFVGYALSDDTDLRLGPVVQHFSNRGTPGGFLETTQPYGYGDFGQAGLRAALSHDTRDRSRHPRSGVLLDIRGDFYPAMWDVAESFGAVRATGGVYVTLPVPLKPYVGLRVIGQRVFGEFPFHEAAFLGGRGGIRSLDPHRYAGDAAVTGKLELRVPLLNVNFLLPLHTGVFAAQEIGRVYVDGASPGGWHDTFGAGVWLGFEDITISFRFIEKNEVGQEGGVGLRVERAVGIP
jgi:hypothetical protein